jgi:hypothetical protein
VEVAQRFTADELADQLQKAEEKAVLWKSVATGLYDYYFLGTGISTCIRNYEDAAND